MRGFVSAAVHNPVAANLLMVVIIVVGGMSAYNLRRETFPQVSFDVIQVQTAFPGATPEEIEESIVVKIEEAIKSVEGIQGIASQANENSGVVLARLKPGMDNRRVLEDIQSEVDKIDNFPEGAEPTRYRERVQRRKVINVAIHGEQPERTLKEVAARVRDDLLASEFISQVRLIGTRDYEISIEVSEASLRRHGLTFDEIRQVVQRSSLNLPGGSIKTPVQAAIDGAGEVALPIIGAVSTTAAAFTPLFIMEGILGKFIAVMSVAVVAALLGSLLECMVILPPHLAHALPEGGYQASRRGLRRLAQRIRVSIDGTLDWIIERVYMPTLRRAMVWRLVVAASAVAILMLMFGLLLGGHLSFELFPDRDTDTVIARLTMPQGTPLAQTAAATARLEDAARQLDDHFRPADPSAAGVVKQIMTVVGFSTDFEPEVGSHVGEATVELLAAEARGIPSTLLADKWRDLSGDVPEALEIIFMSEDIFPVGKPIEVRLMGEDFTEMREAAARLEAELGTYPGVLEISNDFRPGKMEIQLALKPAGRVLGITLADLARQVNQGFHGAEALRLQRGRDDVRVMIRYPEAERRSLGDLDNIRIRTPNGSEVPFGEVATAALRRGFAVIKRADRQRALNVTAEVDSSKANAEKILADLEVDFLPRLLADYEHMRYSFEGQHMETRRSVGSLFRGFIIAMLLVCAILAVIFRSYVQPLVVMSVIPFGLIGAVVGHFVMGHVLSLISLFGLVALSGVLVNDSLVLVDFINRARSRGAPLFEAVLAAGRQRFRAIVLTSVTTVAGLSPILFERSVQAQFLIPMAISMSFGLMGATVLVLILVPALYLLLYDVQSIWHWLRTGSFAENALDPALVDTSS